MIWFMDMDGTVWPATTGPIVLEGDSVVIDGVSREVFRDGLSSVTINGVLFEGREAPAVYRALLSMLARVPFGVVRCGVEGGQAFARVVDGVA